MLVECRVVRPSFYARGVVNDTNPFVDRIGRDVAVFLLRVFVSKRGQGSRVKLRMGLS